MVDALYIPYLKKIDVAKEYICNKYGIDLLIKYHPSLQKQRRLKQCIKSLLGFKKVIDKIRHKEPYIISIDE